MKPIVILILLDLKNDSEWKSLIYIVPLTFENQQFNTTYYINIRKNSQQVSICIIYLLSYLDVIKYIKNLSRKILWIEHIYLFTLFHYFIWHNRNSECKIFLIFIFWKFYIFITRVKNNIRSTHFLWPI